MSLTRFAVRLCAARALRGSTMAEDRVFQSVIDPLDTKVAANLAPTLIVNTDDHSCDTEGRDLTGGEERLDLVIECTIAARVTTTGQDGEGEITTVEIPAHDTGMDLTLDIVEHQVVRALVRGGGDWGALWRRFVLRVHTRKSRRGADTSGVRYAARQLVITCDAISDPVGGEDISPGTVWGDLLALMDADPSLSPVASLIRGQIIGSGDNPDWTRSAAMLGVNADIIQDIGHGPIAFTGDGDPAVLSDVGLTEGGA